MADNYKTFSTSSVTATVADRILSEGKTTRRIFQPEIIDNPNNAEACVKGTIIHQRKGPKDEWESVEAASLNSLKAGEMSKLALSTSETLALFTELKNLFAIYEAKGIPRGERDVIVGYDHEVIFADPGRAKFIRELIQRGHSKEVWELLVNHDEDLATTFCFAQLQRGRVKALREFETALKIGNDERYWQQFFERNTWIFGYGLNYKFLNTVQAQPHYGGATVAGRGDQRGDFLAASAAEVKFTVLVEVKKPKTDLLGPMYRNNAYPASPELAGGTAQLQTNCRQWEIDGSRTDGNRELLGKGNVWTVQPKGILVIGHTSQLGDTAKRTSFEQYRRNMVNPEILTFDELYARAKYIVEHPSQQTATGAVCGE